MSGNTKSAHKTAITLKKKYGEDYYVKIGAIGGKRGTTGGFFANRELAREAGRIGVLRSKRGPITKKDN